MIFPCEGLLPTHCCHDLEKLAVGDVSVPVDVNTAECFYQLILWGQRNLATNRHKLIKCNLIWRKKKMTYRDIQIKTSVLFFIYNYMYITSRRGILQIDESNVCWYQISKNLIWLIHSTTNTTHIYICLDHPCKHYPINNWKHTYALSPVDSDVLVLKHQPISAHDAD